jgi:hypothetical protein
MTEIQQFPLDVVLSVIYRRQMPGTDNEDLLGLLQFMRHQLLLGKEEIQSSIDICREELCRQFPLFDTPEEKEAFEKLQSEMSGHRENNAFKIAQWRAERMGLYGETLRVERISKTKEGKG